MKFSKFLDKNSKVNLDRLLTLMITDKNHRISDKLALSSLLVPDNYNKALSKRDSVRLNEFNAKAVKYIDELLNKNDVKKIRGGYELVNPLDLTGFDRKQAAMLERSEGYPILKKYMDRMSNNNIIEAQEALNFYNWQAMGINYRR